MKSRSPYGERGLKSVRAGCIGRCRRRSPYGERGLKSRHGHQPRHRHGSLSLRRAWIEIPMSPRKRPWRSRRSPYGERGLKFVAADSEPETSNVALLTESVD